MSIRYEACRLVHARLLCAYCIRIVSVGLDAQAQYTDTLYYGDELTPCLELDVRAVWAVLTSPCSGAV